MIDPVLAWLARLALAGVFAAAALHKWRELGAFAAAVAAHRIAPEAWSGALARGFAACETAIAIGLLVPAAAPLAASTAAALLALYTSAIAINLSRGRREIDCGCSARPRPISAGLLARNAALAATAVLAALTPSSRALLWVDAVTAVAGLAALALLWLAAQTLAFGAPARIGRSA